jgi:glycosyltransferase involved in cell wall biosynthesis
MKNILLIYYEPIPSGQTTHVLSLAKGLAQSRYHLTVVMPLALSSCIEDFRQAGVQVVLLPMKKIWWGLRSFRALFQLICQEHYDIVHVHSQEAGLAGRLVSWLAGARRIFYTPQTVDIRRTYLQWIYIIAEVLLANITERIISVNDVDRTRLIRWGIRADKIVTIPNGIDFGMVEKPQDAAELRRSLGVSDGDPLVMQVGRLAEQKDPLAFVQGAEVVLRSCPQARFVMVGDGPMHTEVENYIRHKGLSNRVFSVGHRPNAYHLMAAADVVTLTSRWEGTPYSLMEAMAWKKPVVATAVNGCRELVTDGKTGFLVEAGDQQAWGERVAQLLSELSTRSLYGEAGYKRIKDQYSLEAMVRRLEILYRSMQENLLEEAASIR